MVLFQIRVRIVSLFRYPIEMRHRHDDHFVRLRNGLKGITSLIDRQVQQVMDDCACNAQDDWNRADKKTQRANGDTHQQGGVVVVVVAAAAVVWLCGGVVVWLSGCVVVWLWCGVEGVEGGMCGSGGVIELHPLGGVRHVLILRLLLLRTMKTAIIMVFTREEALISVIRSRRHR